MIVSPSPWRSMPSASSPLVPRPSGQATTGCRDGSAPTLESPRRLGWLQVREPDRDQDGRSSLVCFRRPRGCVYIHITTRYKRNLWDFGVGFGCAPSGENFGFGGRVWNIGGWLETHHSTLTMTASALIDPDNP